MAPYTSVYAYAGNRPTVLTDPSGRCPFCIGAAIGAAGRCRREHRRLRGRQRGDRGRHHTRRHRRIGARGCGHRRPRRLGPRTRDRSTAGVAVGANALRQATEFTIDNGAGAWGDVGMDDVASALPGMAIAGHAGAASSVDTLVQRGAANAARSAGRTAAADALDGNLTILQRAQLDPSRAAFNTYNETKFAVVGSIFSSALDPDDAAASNGTSR